MLSRERPLTWEDLAAMPEDNLRREIIGGELIVTPSPDIWHQKLSYRLLRAFEDASGGRGEWVQAPLDVRLTEFDSVQPDVLYLAEESASKIAGDGRIDGAPDIVVEIVSPSSSSIDRVRKYALYARSGVPEYWIVDPRNVAIDIHTLVDGRYERSEPDVDGRYRSRVLPDLAVHPDTLFAGLG